MKPTLYEIFDRTINLAIRLHTMSEYPEPGQIPEVAYRLRDRAAQALEQARALSQSFQKAEAANAQNRVSKTANLLKQQQQPLSERMARK